MIKSINKILAFFAFSLSFIVYLSTMAPTASLWDCGEFIATSYKLGVPHQPGAPFYILLGNVMTNIPIFENIGARVNFISTIASSLSVMFLYLIIVYIIEYFKGKSKNNIDIVTTNISAFIGAMTFAFTDSHWFNAVESEIYALSTFFTAIVIWLILKWAHDTTEKSWNARYLLLIAYMIGLASGVHLLNLLAIPFIVLIIFFKKFGNKQNKVISSFFKSFIGLLPVLIITFIIFLVINKGIISGLPAIASRIHYFYFFMSFTFILIIAAIGLYHINAKSWIKNKFNFIPNILSVVILFIFTFLTYNAIFIKDAKTLIKDKESIISTNEQELSQFEYAVSLKKQVIQVYGNFNNAWNSSQLSDIKNEINNKEPDIYEILNLDENEFNISIKDLQGSIDILYKEVDFLKNNKIGIFSLLTWQSWLVNLGLFIIFAFSILLLIPPILNELIIIMKARNINKYSYYNQIILSSLLLIIIGFSTYSTIFIRAQQNPNINMSSPDNFDRYVSYMNREQYGDINPFDKDKAMVGQLASNWKRWTDSADKNPSRMEKINFIWEYQIKEMYLRYFAWQFIGRLDKEDADYRLRDYNSFFDKALNWIKELLYQSWERDVIKDGNIIKPNEPLDGINWLRYVFPLAFLFGLIGMIYHFVKDWRRALAVLSLFLITGVILSFYLNMHDPQPRERDYAFVGSFFAFSIWIGLGVSCLQRGVKRFFEYKNVSVFISSGLALIIILLMPFNMYNRDYKEHDRSQNFVAWDYAYNILNSCEPNAIIFTNGDNDTYPLWYLQEVEEIRTDVIVVNFSLLNTAWYVNQLIKKAPELQSVLTKLNFIEGSLNNNNGADFILPHWLQQWSENNNEENKNQTIQKEIKVFKNKKNIFNHADDYLIAKFNGMTCGLSSPSDSLLTIIANNQLENIRYKFYDASENKIFDIKESHDFSDYKELANLELSIKNDIDIYDLESNVEYSTLASWKLCDQSIKSNHYDLYQNYGIDTLIQERVINSSEYIDCKLQVYLGNDSTQNIGFVEDETFLSLVTKELTIIQKNTPISIQDVTGGFQVAFYNKETEKKDIIFLPNSSLDKLNFSYFDFQLPRKHRFYILIQDYMVLEIINNLYHTRPIYFAATTPNLLGLNKYLQMEGMVYKLNYYNENELNAKNKFSNSHHENDWRFINYDKMLNNLIGTQSSKKIINSLDYNNALDNNDGIYRFTNLNNSNIYYNHNIKRMMSNYRMAYLSLMQYELNTIKIKVKDEYKKHRLRKNINHNTSFIELDLDDFQNSWNKGTIITINNEHIEIIKRIDNFRFEVSRGFNSTIKTNHNKDSFVSELITLERYNKDITLNSSKLQEIIEAMNYNLPYELFPLNPWLSIQFIDKVYSEINSDHMLNMKEHIKQEIKNDNNEMHHMINKTVDELEQNNIWNKLNLAMEYKDYNYINRRIDLLKYNSLDINDNNMKKFISLYRLYVLSSERQYNQGIILSASKLLDYPEDNYNIFIKEYLGDSVLSIDLKRDIINQLIINYQLQLEQLGRLKNKDLEKQEIKNNLQELVIKYPNILNEAN